MAELTYTTKDLKTALAQVGPFVSGRSSIQVLGGVLLAPGTIRATDMETWATARIATTGTAQIVLPYKALKDAVAAWKQPTITITADDESETHDRYWTPKAKVGATSLYGITPSDFPQPVVATGAVFTSPDFLTALPTVLLAASEDETRPMLATVLMHNGRLVATDSYRLHVAAVTVNDAPDDGVVIPAATLRGLLKSKPSGPVTFTKDSATLQIAVGNLTLGCRSDMDAKHYPSYKQLVPATFDTTAIFDRAAMIETAKAAGKIATKNAPLRLSYNGNGHLDVRAESQDVGSFEASVDVALEGDMQEIGFNPGFFVDALAMCEETATFRCINPLRPAVFGNDDRFALLMPIRLSD